MSLSNSVTTMLIDPRSNNNTRCEFRLDDDYYASNLKLIDVGVTSTEVAGSSGVGGAAKIMTYPQINGVYQCIRNIYLYSGSTLIDSVQNCAQYSAIQAMKTNNQGSTDLNRDLILNGLGFQRARVGDNVAAGGGNGYAARRPASMATTLANDSAKQCAVHSTNGQIANNQSLIGSNQDSQSGAVSLGVFLQFLKSVSILPRIPDLRLVIEWDTNLTSYFDQLAGGAVTGVLNIIRPTLVVEKLEDMPNEPENVVFPYMSTIVERFNVPQAYSVAPADLPSDPFAITANSTVVTATLSADLGLRVNEPISFSRITDINRAQMDLPTDPITLTTGANSTVTVTMAKHGFATGDTVVISGIAGGVGGANNAAFLTKINDATGNTITVVDAGSFTFTTTIDAAAPLVGGGAAGKLNGSGASLVSVDATRINGSAQGFTVASVAADGLTFTFNLAAVTKDSPSAVTSGGGTAGAGTGPLLSARTNRLNQQQSSFRSQAFTEKFVRELVFFNNTTASLAANKRFVTAATRSPAQLNERLQLIVNNRNHLPDQGISNEAMRVMYLNSAQSNMNIPYICMLSDSGDQRNAVTAAGGVPNNDNYQFIYPHGALKNNFSITAAKVGARVENLRIEHQREYGSTEGSQGAYTLLCFGTVARTMTMKNGNVSISY
tara:strand:- start:3162 stop:5153 length:1992 start_codon:yes stop_codon:yes gene_type:complete